MPKHWWTGTDANGKPRDITAGTLETPLGNGAYRIKTVIPGRTISYERVPDYWGKDLPVNVGKDNFDEIRWEYYRDDTVELEAFKADHYDFRIEILGQELGHRLRFPRPPRWPRPSGELSRARARRDAGASSSICAATSSRIRACGSPSTMHSISRR